MKKQTSIILIIISIICIALFVFLLASNNTQNTENINIQEFTGSKINVSLNDNNESKIEAKINENNELVVNAKSLTNEDKYLTLDELQEMGFSPIVKTTLDNTNIYLYTPDENMTEEDKNRVKNTLDLNISGVTYKDANKLGNLINGPVTEENTHYFPLSYSPYGTVMVYDGFIYDEKVLPVENLNKFAEEYSNLVNELVIWDEDEKGYNLELNTVKGAHIKLDEEKGKFIVSSPYLRFDFQHITETINGETYFGNYANNLLEDAHAKTLLAALNFFGDKAYAERVFSMIDNYYFFNKNNNKPITKEFVEKYELKYIKDVPSATFNGKNELYRDLYVSYNDVEWIISYNVGTRSSIAATIDVIMPIKRNS